MRNPVPTIADDQLDDIQVQQNADRLLALHESHDSYAQQLDARRRRTIAQLVDALKSARDMLAAALRSTSPDWFQTEADIAAHVGIKQIDDAIAKAEGGQPCPYPKT